MTPHPTSFGATRNPETGRWSWYVKFDRPEYNQSGETETAKAASSWIVLILEARQSP